MNNPELHFRVGERAAAIEGQRELGARKIAAECKSQTFAAVAETAPGRFDTKTKAIRMVTD
jgi:hypothetical protein